MSPQAQQALDHDDAGNLEYDGEHKFIYDAWNRLVEVKRAYGNTPTVTSKVGTIRYDGLGRQVSKAISESGDWSNGSTGMTCHYYYDGQAKNMIETRNGSDESLTQHVWGLTYVDELLRIDINDDPATENVCVDYTYYALQDANFNVLGLVESDGDLAERYEYTPYGQRTIYKSAGSDDALCMAPILESQRKTVDSPATAAYGICDIGHQGLMHDKEFGLIYNRARCLSPKLGRFLQRDPMAYVDGMSLYEYVRSGPIGHVDWIGGATTRPTTLPVFLAVQGDADAYDETTLGFGLDANVLFTLTKEGMRYKYWYQMNKFTTRFFNQNHKPIAQYENTVIDAEPTHTANERGEMIGLPLIKDLRRNIAANAGPVMAAIGVMVKGMELGNICYIEHVEVSKASLHNSIKVQSTKNGKWEEYRPTGPKRHRSSLDRIGVEQRGMVTHHRELTMFLSHGPRTDELLPRNIGQWDTRPGDEPASGSVVTIAAHIYIDLRKKKMKAWRRIHLPKGSISTLIEFKYDGPYPFDKSFLKFGPAVDRINQ